MERCPQSPNGAMCGVLHAKLGRLTVEKHRLMKELQIIEQEGGEPDDRHKKERLGGRIAGTRSPLRRHRQSMPKEGVVAEAAAIKERRHIVVRMPATPRSEDEAAKEGFKSLPRYGHSGGQPSHRGETPRHVFDVFEKEFLTAYSKACPDAPIEEGKAAASEHWSRMATGQRAVYRALAASQVHPSIPTHVAASIRRTHQAPSSSRSPKLSVPGPWAYMGGAMRRQR